MAGTHELIVNKLRIFWSKMNLGRLYHMRVGKAVPLNGNFPVDFGAGIKGFSDEFGFTKILITADMIGKVLPIFTVVEVKTKRDTLRKDQILFLDYMVSIGGHAYIAREDNSPEGYELKRWGE